MKDEREAQLTHAARLVRKWAEAQRATWSGAPLVWPPTEDEMVALEEVPEAIDAAVSGPAVPEPVAQAAPAEVLASVAPTPTQNTTTVAIARFPVRLVVRWSFLVGVVAACVAVTAIAGTWAWGRWTAWKNTPVIGTVVVQSDPTGALVTIDGASEGVAPLTKQLAPGRHVIQFRRRDQTRTLDVDVVKDQSTIARLDWNQPQTGRLEVRSDPVGAHVKIDGRDRGVTPLVVDAIPVGSHLVVLESDRGSISKKITVETSGTLVNEQIFAGWIRVSSPFEVQVRESSRTLRLDERQVALVGAGPHDLLFENARLGFKEVRHVEILPGATTDVVLNPPASTVSVTATAPSEVLIDGERAGATPLTDYPVRLGQREVTITSGAGAQRHVSLTITTAPARIDVDFSKP